MGGDVECGHALHEAGRQATEAAVPERSVGLEVHDPIEIDAEALQRFAHRVEQAEVRERVAGQPPDEELE